ncbi:MAG: hypothetical protein WC423_25495 [Vulcanimicrobiota bacterium]
MSVITKGFVKGRKLSDRTIDQIGQGWGIARVQVYLYRLEERIRRGLAPA